jgi:hydrogenase maturation protease
MSENRNKILVLGLGNDILTDDAIGIHVVREVRRRVVDMRSVDVRETGEMGLALLDVIVGYRALVLVDSVQAGNAPPGFIHEINGAGLKLLPGSTPHFLGVGETLALGRKLGMAMPERVKIFAIEVADPFTLGTQMTPVLRESLASVVDLVVAEIRDFAQKELKGQGS